MKFTFDRDAMIKEIAIAQEIITNKSPVSILSNILIIAENNSLTIKATDSTYGCKIIVYNPYNYYISKLSEYNIYKGDTNSQQRITGGYSIYYHTITYSDTDEITVKFDADNGTKVSSKTVEKNNR